MNILMQELNKYDFIELHNNEANPRARTRLLALQHKKEGKSYIEIGNIFKKRRQTIMDWCNWLLEYGLKGLYDDHRSGRTPILARKNEPRFLKELGKLQDEKDGGRITAEDIRVMLKEKFNAEYSTNSVYDLLERLNIVWITGRSIHPKADKEAQEEFKKKSSGSSKKMSTSKCISR